VSNSCIHQIVTAGFRAADKTDPACGKPAFTKATNGYLCIGHYRQQQQSIPAKVRKAQPKWRGLVPQSDEQIIADIIASDKRAIENGTIVLVKRGAHDPIVLRLLESPTVH
jgi:hypothetical protein